VKEIWTYDGSWRRRSVPQSVTLVLEDDVDVSRGDMVVGLDLLPGDEQRVAGAGVLDGAAAAASGAEILLKHTSQTVQAVVTGIESRLDIRTFEAEPGPAQLALNDLGEIRLRTSRPLIHDGYVTNRLTGAFILIEPGTHMTVAAGMLHASHRSW
jgi:sulfate adenylyltransferase subunit 1